jgi:hypothetical protein
MIQEGSHLAENLYRMSMRYNDFSSSDEKYYVQAYEAFLTFDPNFNNENIKSANQNLARRLQILNGEKPTIIERIENFFDLFLCYLCASTNLIIIPRLISSVNVHVNLAKQIQSKIDKISQVIKTKEDKSKIKHYVNYFLRREIKELTNFNKELETINENVRTSEQASLILNLDVKGLTPKIRFNIVRDLYQKAILAQAQEKVDHSSLSLDDDEAFLEDFDDFQPARNPMALFESLGIHDPLSPMYDPQSRRQ